jgi:hypothetical protein
VSYFFFSLILITLANLNQDMSVSYRSKTIQSSPYVLPVDLNLFGKVMSYKQGQYDQGTAAIQGGIDKLGSLDVMKGTDREYLNSKINTLVNQVNGIEGDLSDRNTLNQIEGLGSDIYTDDKVINALSSTASVRNLMKTYDTYKSNPKLSKLYSPVNEAYDMSKVSDWMNDGQVGSTYHGASTATPYVPYRENHLKAFEKIKADLVETLDDKGLFILKQSREHVSPERLMSMAADLLTPDERGQMKKDAWYLYNVQSPTAPETLINKGMQQYYGKVSEAKTTWDTYEAQAKAASNDAVARDNYVKLAEQAKNNFQAIASQEKNTAQSLVQAYQNDPEEFQYQLYSNDYFRGLANRFSVNRTSRSIQFDQAEMFQMKMNQSDDQFKERMKRVDRGLDIQEKKAMMGFYKTLDPKTGKYIMVPGDGLNSSNLNTQDPSSLKVNDESINNANIDLYKQIDGIHQDFIDNIVAERPDLGITTQSQNGAGLVRILKGQQAAENFNGRPGFQLDDLGSYEANREGYKKSYGMTDAQLDYLKTLYTNYQAMRLGKGASLPDLPTGFADVVEQTTLIKDQIDANNTKIKEVNKAVLSKYLSPAEVDLMMDYGKNPAKYTTQGGSATVKAGDFSALPKGLMDFLLTKGPDSELYHDRVDNRIADIRKKLKAAGVDYDAEKQKYYDQIASRDVYRTRTFQDQEPLVKSGNIQRFVWDNLKSATALEGSSSVKSDDVTSLDAIVPITAGMAADGSGQFYITAKVVTGSGDSKSSSTIKIPVDDQNARKLGLQRDPYESINYSVRLTGRTGDIPVYSNKNLAVTVNVVGRNSKSANDDSSFAQAKFFFLDKNGNPTDKYQLVNIPATEGRTPSEAYALAKQAVLQAGRAGITFDQFKQYLYEFKPSN